MTSVSFVSSNRSVGLNQFHLEWCPKYRKAVMVGDVKRFLWQSIINTAHQYNILIHSMEIASEHVHLFVSLPFNTSPSEAMRLFKGRSSHSVFAAFPWLRNVFGKGHFWSPGKFCRSISNVKSDTIGHYIEGHKFKELNQSIYDAREEAKQAQLSAFF
ncbi:MAG: IS200/IS605 family transposase [Candidatus Micrarchaeota archaeon]